MRLGVYMDLDYAAHNGDVFTEHAVIQFLVGLRGRVGELTLFGRLADNTAPGAYHLPPDINFRPLPHYPSLTHLRSFGAAARKSVHVVRHELENLDALWLFGPHPFSFLFAALARRRDKAVFFGVRQDFPQYIGNRLPSPLWAWAIPVAWSAEWAYRLLARRFATVVVGDDLARKYGGHGRPVLATGISLIRPEDLIDEQEALGRPWTDELRIVNVGRLDPEKNPTLLPEILAGLRTRDDRWKLTIVGTGPMMEPVRQRAAELGVSEHMELLGYVANGPELRTQYRRGQAFLHVSFTEGLPQVLFEAQAAGLPIVATDVGGVSQALAGGDTGLLVPPADAQAAERALERLRDDEALRRRLISLGLGRAREETMDAQLDRITRFLLDHSAPAR